MTSAPPEPGNGQDDTPDVRTAVVAVLLMLRDVHDYLGRQFPDTETREMRERIAAHTRALARLRRRLENR